MSEGRSPIIYTCVIVQCKLKRETKKKGVICAF